MRPSLVVPAVALLLASACTSVRPAPEPPPVSSPERAVVPTTPEQERTPTGRVRVAQPDPVDSWWQASPEDLAAGDLAALWSLPLFRVDPLGRPVPALATGFRVVEHTEDAWVVEVELAAGTWSDGTPVTADDVVATAEALAEVRPAEWAAWTGATAVDDTTVRLRFDRPYAGWLGLLSRSPGVLPAAVLADDGLGAYDEGLPVTGGWFRLEQRTPGVSASFTANPDSPLGAPGLAAVEVLVVPDHEVALGLLADGEVDVVAGHVALDPQRRRAQVPDVEGGAVFGGTRIELVWDDGGRADRAVRRTAATRLDPVPYVDGLLRDVGRRAGGVLPVLELVDPRAPEEGAGGEVAIQVVRTVEGLGLLARLLQADLQAGGVSTALVRVDPPQHLARPLEVDGRLRVVRVDPWRSAGALLASLGLDSAAGVVADAEGTDAVDPVGARVLATGAHAEVAELLAGEARLVVVAEVAVAHVWHPDRVAGVTPSSWPGLALWDVGHWRVPTG